MRPGWIITGLLLVLGAGGCARFVDYGDGYSQQQKPAANRSVVYHKVRKGDTLYSIAWQYGYDYRSLSRWNRIAPPYTIYPGQKLRVMPPKKRTNAKPVTKKQWRNKRTPPPKATRRAASSSRVQKISWRWPTEGKLLSRFVAGEPTRQGIDIGGRKGQAIKAAASGRVVYSGNGLRGYGNLVIIKHNETYFSAYAHNNRVYVKEDDLVKSGQKIADMGHNGAKRAMLHFEIRRNGKPSNPLKYLPKRGHEG